MSIKIESETKTESDPCVVAWDNQLFVGTEDGSIKVTRIHQVACVFSRQNRSHTLCHILDCDRTNMCAVNRKYVW